MRALRLAVLLVPVVSSCGLPPEEEPVAQRSLGLGSPALIRDLEPSVGLPIAASSNPIAFTRLPDGGAVFFASTPTEGREVYRTDGTAAGTALVADTNAGPGGVATTTAFFTEWNGVLYFTGSGPSGFELYRTDGTAAGTGLVTDVCVGCNGVTLDSSGNRPMGPGRISTGLAWLGSTAGGATMVYASDGTAAGTRAVAPVVNVPSVFASTGARIYFDNGSSFSSTTGVELWSSDGTDAGTGMVVDLQPGAGSSAPYLLTPVGNTLYFFGRASQTMTELWRTDGTPANTARVASLGDVVVQSFVVSGPKAYLVWFPTGNNSAARLDLIDLGTGARQTLGPASVFSHQPIPFAPDRLGYVAGSSVLLGTDGTDAGVTLLTSPISINALGAVDGFGWWGLSGGLWRTDGTTAGTTLVGAIDAGTGMAAFGPCAQGRVCFAASSPVGTEPWVFDGVRVSPLGDLSTARGNSSQPFANRVVVGNQLLFTATTSANGEELWRTDGVSASLVRDFAPGTTSGSPRKLVEAQGKAYFLIGSQLYRSDGTDAGTELLALPQPGTLRELTGTSLGAFATVTLGNNTHAVYAWLGADAGATTVAIFPTVTVPARPPGLFTAIGDTVFFYGWTPTGFGQVWRTDGTPGNTVAITSLNPSAGNQLYNFTNFQNRLYFSGNAGAILRLECSGSTSTVGSNQGRSFTPSGDSLFMEGSANGLDFSLYRVQGTTGTQVIELNTSGTDTIRELQPWNGGVVFSATNGVERKLYFSDGTAAGTRPLTNLPLPLSTTTDALAVQGGHVYVGAQVPDAGFELVELHLDGGFSLVGDFAPGLSNSNATAAAVLGTRLIFSADTAAYGREPWVVDVDRVAVDGGTALAPCVWPVVDAGIGIDAGTTDAGMTTDAGTTDAGTTDAGTTDAGTMDAGTTDAGTTDAGLEDAGTSTDAGIEDAGTSTDAGSEDAGTTTDAGTEDGGATTDAGAEDAGTTTDAGTEDAGTSDAGGTMEPGPVTAGCGCRSIDGASVVALLALTLIRRRRS